MSSTTAGRTSDLYSALELKNAGDIRLARIFSNETGKLRCELRVVDLERSPQYLAVSYTWGPSTNEEAAREVTNNPSQSITCNGHDVLITTNLYNFLVRVASKDIARYEMWFDILCINQSDDIERSKQVKMMASIYNSAQLVVIWLGEEDQYTEDAFALVRRLGSLEEPDLKSITPRSMASEATLTLLHPYGDLKYWTAVTKLFQRRYFTRIWIIQEITLARRRLAICGSHEIAWDHVVEVSKFLTVTSWTRWICPGNILATIEGHQSSHAIPNLVEANRRTSQSNEKNILMYSLIRSRRFEASDQRDKIYALLGIVQHAVKAKERYEPVYVDRSPAETYTLAAIQLLEDSDDLLVLAHAEGHVFRVTAGLPSWVPDWSCTKVVGLGVTGYTRYSACGNPRDIRRHLRIDEQARKLHVKGIRLDHVGSVAESKEEMLRGQPFENFLNMVSSVPQVDQAGRRLSNIIWRVLLTNTAGTPPMFPAPIGYGPAFASWFMKKLEGIKEHVSPALISQAIKALDITNLISTTAALDTEDVERVDAQDYEAAFSHSPHLRPFTTTGGCIGIGSESIMNGDSIWILAGSRVPIILKHMAQNSYQVVGGAYVHGFMQGEGLEVGSFEDIVLA